MEERNRLVMYLRYSSEAQSDGFSIEAQKQACEIDAKRKGYHIVDVYIDRAKSARNDRRTEYIRLMKDAEEDKFDIVMVHKLDRLRRNVRNYLECKSKLERNNVRLESVIENFDDTPEGEFSELVISGIGQYFSRNLARESMKGMRIAAQNCQHVGGSPALGYSVNKATKKYIINEKEAKAVRLIFEKYLQGHTVMSIVTELNSRGYKTKKGAIFGTNSIRNIIKNEKYCGTYVFNKSASKDVFGRRNGNKTKDDSEIIKIKGGMPAIISEDDYNRAQALMETRRNGGQGRQKAKEIYLLSGIIRCSCNCAMYGNRRKPKGKPLYISYRCKNRHKKGASSECKTPEIRKEYIEEYVLTELENFLVNDDTASSIVDSVNKYVYQENNVYREKLSYIEKELATIKGGIENIINAIMGGFSAEELQAKLDELKKEKTTLELEKSKYSKEVTAPKIDVQTVREKLNNLKEYIKTRNLPECKKLIKDFVKEVVVYGDHVEVKLNMVSFVFEDLEAGETIKKKRKDLYVKHSHDHYFSFLRDRGYKYSREVSYYGVID